MKILISGTNATHCFPATHDRMPNFLGLIRHSLSWESDIQVEQRDITPFEDFSQYDKIILGLAPLTGSGARNVLPTLLAIRELFHTDKLVLAIDCDNLTTFTRSLEGLNQAVKLEKLLKKVEPLYTSGTSQGRQWLYEAMGAVARLEYDCFASWDVPVLVPAYPWAELEDYESELPGWMRGKVVLMNFDKALVSSFKKLDKTYLEPSSSVSNSWSSRARQVNSKTGKLSINWDINQIRANQESNKAENLAKSILGSAAHLVQPTKRAYVGWRPDVAAAIALKRPVHVPHGLADKLGSAWSRTAEEIESMDSQSLEKLAQEQHDTYLNCIPNQGMCHRYLLNTLGYTAKEVLDD